MDKVLKFTTHREAARDEARYWRSLSVEDRVSAVELLREVTLGVYGETTPRLERVHQLVVRAPRPVPDRGGSRASGER